MEVTNKNFDELFPEIEKSIDDCNFLAIDCEFSGLQVNDVKDNLFETVEDRYPVMRESASKFLVIQFGLCPFFYDKEKDAFYHKTYNFYTFPRQFGHNAPNIRFLCESSSLEFLSSNNFDFNKLIYEGIPYLTFENEQKMRDDIDKRIAFLAEENSSPLSVPENLKKFMDETEGRIKRFLISSMEEMEMESLNPFQRKLVFHNIKPKYSNLLYFEVVQPKDESDKSDEGSDSVPPTKCMKQDSLTNKNVNKKNGTNSQPAPPRDNRSRVLRVVKLNEAEQNKRDEEKKKLEMDVISKGVGFSKVIRKISQSNKLIVGHNMLLDCAHTIHQFVDDLPETLAEFKILVQTTFPNLIDTKYMSSIHPFKEHITSSALFDLDQRLREKPFTCQDIRKLPGSKGYELNEIKEHEAGWDAFVTGCAFIGMCQYLGTLQQPKKTRVLAESPLVMPYLNKLYLMRLLDVTYLNISGTDLTPSRSHVFHISCPKTATVKEIQHVFSPFGGIQIWWNNNESLFVSLSNKEQASFVMKNVECSSDFRILPFDEYQKLQADKKRPLKNESPNRNERCGAEFKKVVEEKSPIGEQKKKRSKIEAGTKKIFDEPTWN